MAAFPQYGQNANGPLNAYLPRAGVPQGGMGTASASNGGRPVRLAIQ